MSLCSLRQFFFVTSILAGTCAFSASDAEAASADSKTKAPVAEKSNHSWKGNVLFGLSSDSNAGTGPTTPGGAKKTSSISGKGVGAEGEDDEEDEDLIGELDLDDDEIGEALGDLEDEDDLREALIAAGVDPEDVQDIIDEEDEDDINALPAAQKAAKNAANGARGKRIRSERATFRGQLGHAYQFSKSFKWKNQAAYAQSVEREFTKKEGYTLALSSGPEFKLSYLGGLTLSPAVNYGRVSSDYAHVMNVYSGSFGIAGQFIKSLKWKAKAARETRNFTRNANSNVEASVYKAGLAYAPTKKDTFSVGTGWRLENVKPTTKQKDSFDYSISYARKMPYDMAGVVAYAHKLTEYAAGGRGVPIREDKQKTYSAALTKKFPDGITTQLQYQFTGKRSNIASNEAVNNRVAVVTSWSF